MKWLTVQEGVPNPRNPEEIGFRNWETFEDTQEGLILARKALQKLEIGRLIRCETIRTRGFTEKDP